MGLDKDYNLGGGSDYWIGLRGCDVRENTDLVGNDIKSVDAKLGDCCGHCSATPGCVAWSWSATYNKCWLKSSSQGSAPSTGVYFGLMSPKKATYWYYNGISLAHWVYRWQDNFQRNFINWAPNQPVYTGNENCGYAGPSLGNKWATSKCDVTKNSFICKKTGTYKKSYI